MRKINLSILSLVILVLMSSCSSFNNGITKHQKITVKTISKLNGNYEIIASNEDSLVKKNWKYNNVYQELNRKLLKDTLDLDVTKNYSLDIAIVNAETIQLIYKMNTTAFKTQNIKCKLKKDGYLYLKNKNVRCILVPYICGAIDVKKVRLALDENNNLLFDVYNHRSGAFMIVGFLDGRTYRYRKIYSKID